MKIKMVFQQLAYDTFAVNVVVWAFASVGRIQVLATVLALVTLLVPRLDQSRSMISSLEYRAHCRIETYSSSSEHLLGSVDVTTATRATLAFRGLGHWLLRNRIGTITALNEIIIQLDNRVHCARIVKV